jgi:predicted DCC family thiol-disulfide oxidoreductase YuxK
MTLPKTSMTPTLFYDNDCGFCTAATAWYSERAAERGLPVQLVAYGDSKAPAQYPQIDWAHREAGIQLLSGSGTLFRDAEAAAEALCYLGGAFRFIGKGMRLPGVRTICQTGYRWVAANRQRISRLLGLTTCRIP